MSEDADAIRSRMWGQKAGISVRRANLDIDRVGWEDPDDVLMDDIVGLAWEGAEAYVTGGASVAAKQGAGGGAKGAA